MGWGPSLCDNYRKPLHLLLAICPVSLLCNGGIDGELVVQSSIWHSYFGVEKGLRRGSGFPHPSAGIDFLILGGDDTPGIDKAALIGTRRHGLLIFSRETLGYPIQNHAVVV